MGFIGLQNWRLSDNSADFVLIIKRDTDKLSGKEKYDKIGQLCLEHVHKTNNCYNTSGWIDVILYMEDFLLHDPTVIKFTDQNSDLFKSLVIAKEYCEKFVSDFDTSFKQDMVRMYNNIIIIIHEIRKCKI